MDKPKFNVPKPVQKRAGRIALFLCSVAAVSYVLIRTGQDYGSIYSKSPIDMGGIAKVALSITQHMSTYWWIVGLASIVIVLFFYAVTKSGTVFTIMSVLVWLTGGVGYIALWLPSRLIEKSAGG